LQSGGAVYSLQQLHAKVYIFDDLTAVVTSANLTARGLKHNYEYGIQISDPTEVAEICGDFDEITRDENLGIIDLTTLEEAEQILDRAPPPQRPRLPRLHVATLGELAQTEPETAFDGDIEAIRSVLSGWKLSVFDVLMSIPGERFALSEVYRFVPELEEQYPDNRHIEAKIRQQLQYLAKLGLVEFLEPGRYRKLWRQPGTSS